MKNVYCPHCNHTLTAWEGYKVINFRHLECPNCGQVLVPCWHKKSRPLWQKRALVLAWSFPAMLAMTVVWLEPQWWLSLVLGLIVFHVLALAIICVGGYYRVKIKD